jgi:hypothetical protein
VYVWKVLVCVGYVSSSVVGYHVLSVEKHPNLPRESPLAMVGTCPMYMWDKYIGNGYENTSEMETGQNTLVLVTDIVVILS